MWIYAAEVNTQEGIDRNTNNPVFIFHINPENNVEYSP